MAIPHWLSRSYFRLLLVLIGLSLTMGGGCDCNGTDDEPRDVGTNDVLEDIGEREDATEQQDVTPEPDVTQDADPTPDADANDQPPKPTALLFFVHNSPDPGLATLDIYLGGERIIDDLDFRSAQTFTEVDAGTLTLSVAPDDSQSDDDALATFPDLEVQEGQRYIIVLNGLLDPDDFDDNPDEHSLDLALYTFPDARDASTKDDQSQVLLFHGAPDAESLTIHTGQDDPTLSNLAYGNFHDSYLDFEPGHTPFDLFLGDDALYHASYQTSDLKAQDAYLLLTSGFLNTSQNDDAPFELVLFPTTADDETIIDGTILDHAAQVRFVHASIDPAVATADLYLDDRLVVTELNVNHATDFLTLRSGQDLELRITAPDNADDLGTQTVSFEPGARYFAVLSGVSDTDAYPENPDKVDLDLAISTFQNPRHKARQNDDVDILTFHGAMDLPDIRVIALLSDNSEIQLVEKFRHTSFAAYKSLPPQSDITIEVRNPDDASPFVTKTISLEDFEGQAPLLIITGLNAPGDADDPDAPPLSLLIVDHEGDVTPID